MAARIMKEIENIKKMTDIFTFTDFNQNPDGTFIINGILKGPLDSPYEHGLFPIQIKIPIKYPFEPLEFKFVHPVPFNPYVVYDNNGGQLGRMCITILEKAHWSPIHTCESIIRSIHSLLTDYSSESFANQEAGSLHRNDVDKYNEAVKAIIKRNGQYHPEEPAPGGGGASAPAPPVEKKEEEEDGSNWVYSDDEDQGGGNYNKRKYLKYTYKLKNLK
jgi:ubiquitin-protein ligase